MKFRGANMKKRHTWWLLLIITIAFPFAMDHLIIGNDFFSNISNSDWVSFLASYIGAITSAAGIIITIEHTKKEAREDRRLLLAPLLSYEVEKRASFDDIDSNNSITLFESHQLNLDKEDEQWTQRLIIKIENIGMGPLLNLKITDIKLDEHNFEDVKTSGIQKVLKKDSVLYIKASFIHRAYSFEALDKGKTKPDAENINLSFVLRYDDAINTHYEEKVTSKFSIFFVDQPLNSIWSANYSFSVSNIEKANRK